MTKHSIRNKIAQLAEESSSTTFILFCITIGILTFGVVFSMRGNIATPQSSNQKSVTDIASSLYILPPTSFDHYKSTSTSPITLIEYIDLDCPHCARLYQAEKPIYASTFKNKFTHIYRHFPLDDIHENAAKKALILECLTDSRGDVFFFRFLDEYFETQSVGGSMGVFTSFAEHFASKAEIAGCLENKVFQDRINTSVAEALRTGIFSTPSMVRLIDGKIDKRFDLLGAGTGLGVVRDTLTLAESTK